MIDACAIALLKEDTEYYDEFCESAGEIYAEYRSEMNHYGDAWVGSADQIARIQDSMFEMERDMALIRAVSPPWIPLSLGNKVALEGVTRCECGSKYWENDRCVDCGSIPIDEPF